MNSEPRPLVTARAFSWSLIALCQFHLSGAGILLSTAFLASSAEAAEARSAYSVTEVDRAPAPKREIRVRFPRSIRKEHGEITLRFIVTARGDVTQLTVVKFSDPDMIDAAYDAYEDADFVPGMKNGQPVDTWVEVTQVAK
jgi:TonB family protein